MFSFQNKYIFIDYANDALNEKSTNILVFLASSINNFQK